MSSTKSHFASSTHSGNGNDLSPFTGSTSASGKDVEQPISAKSMSSTSTSSATGQSVPSYSSIWRPELPGTAMTSMTSAKYPVISNSGGYGFSRGKTSTNTTCLSNGQIETELGNRIYSVVQYILGIQIRNSKN